MNMPRKRSAVGRLLMLVLLAAGTPHVFAEEDISSDRLLACASLRENMERLACYDRLAARISTGADEGVSSAPAPLPEEMFGLSVAAADKGRSQAAVERRGLDSITAQVVSVQERRPAGVLLELDNGQMWRQLDDKPLLIKEGDSVKISRGALGSFRLTAPSGRGARVRRVR